MAVQNPLSDGLASKLTARVVYWTNIPAPYMVDRFNALARRENLQFEAWFSARTKKGRSWRVDEGGWDFPHRYLPSINRGAYPLAVPTPLLLGEVPDLLVTLHAAPSFLFGCMLARSRGAKTAFWVLVTFDAWVNRRQWKEAVKSWAFSHVDAVLTPGNDGRRFAERYGTPSERIFWVPQVIDAEYYAQASNLSQREREGLRRALGLHGITFLYVGRLWVGKGLTFLLDAFRDLQSRAVGETTLLLVGNGPDEELLREKAQGAGNVVFVGFHDAETLPQLYAASDVFVFPTLGDPFGLVVLEAMACGLPVVASSASGEIRDRVGEGVNGFIVEPANVRQLLDRMSVLARDAELRRRMGKAGADRVAGQTPDLWAEAFERAVVNIIAMPSVNRDSS
jgi:glycosyltransferase involved in cell wall biosynthesis